MDMTLNKHVRGRTNNIQTKTSLFNRKNSMGPNTTGKYVDYRRGSGPSLLRVSCKSHWTQHGLALLTVKP